MNTATSRNEMSAYESGYLRGVRASGSESHPQVTAAETDDMSPRARKIVYLSLLAGVLLLGSVAAYVWYGYYLWRNIP